MSEDDDLPPVPPGFDAFEDAWRTFFTAARRARARDSAAPRGGALTMPQFTLLDPLLEEDPLGVRALAEAGGVAPPTATRMLDVLDRQGIVERAPSPADGRAVEVRLTVRGRELVAAKRAFVHDLRVAVWSALPPDQRASAPAVLRSLADAIDQL